MRWNKWGIGLVDAVLGEKDLGWMRKEVEQVGTRSLDAEYGGKLLECVKCKAE